MSDPISMAIAHAAVAIHEADALLIGAGAGMGVDSGLPDFRGPEGFWKAYPPLAKLGLSFSEIAQPRWFARDPELAWGFYGHRLHLYRSTVPHEGFTLLRHWAETMPHGYFVYTSNVDGQFQKAGFDPERIVECHGSLNHLQCRLQCCEDIWNADDLELTIDPETLRTTSPLPLCSACGHIARPNVLMFNDWAWQGDRAGDQEEQFAHWISSLPRAARLVIVECGAGGAIPTVRWLSDRLTSAGAAALVRINPRDTEVPRGGISLALGAREGLQAIAERLPELV